MTISKLIEKLEKARQLYGDDTKVEIDTGYDVNDVEGVVSLVKQSSKERVIKVHSLDDKSFEGEVF